ncbi:MAG TPA: hypothetical protein VMC79_10295 [Rectinemataceae bacterium]|nr:hypothetical protein [Rectinemataceae bacterium]
MREATIPDQTPVTVAVLVVSCDRYADLWPPFFAQIGRHWPGRSWPLYLLSNQLEPELPATRVLAVGEDRSWSDNLKAALTRLTEEYILLFLEDLVLRAPVDQALLERVMAWVEEVRPDCVRLNASERPDEATNDLVGRVKEGALYRSSAVLSLWKREVLNSLLKDGESAWQFEILGSARTDAYPEFYVTRRGIFPVINCVIKGKWRRRAVRQLGRQGLRPDLGARAVMTRAEELRFMLRECRSWLFKLVPMRYRRRIRAWFIPRTA